MSSLLVPLTVDTVVVRPGAPAETWAKTRYTPPQLPARVPGAPRQPRVRQAIFPPPFAQRDQPRAPGVHLHWALPDALTIFDAETGELPPLPCRWLVVRLDHRQAAGGGGWSRGATTWLLPNLHDPASTWLRGGHAQQHPIGRGTPPLTIRGQGATRTFSGWAFYADNVEGRLAFHDPLDHPSDAGLQGPVSYLVMAWYTHMQHDPLTPQPGRTVQEVLADLGWSIDERVPIDPPTRVVVHGAALAIAWPTAAAPLVPAEVDLRPAAASISAAIADTLTAATAALVFPTATGAMEGVAEAVVAGQLDELDQPDGGARLDGTRHQLRFGATATGAGQSDVIFESSGAVPAVLDAPAGDDDAERAAARADDAGALDAPFHALRLAFGEPAADEDEEARSAAPAAPPDAADAGDLESVESGQLVPVRHPTPRRWGIVDPVVALAGLGRSLRHGHDGRFDPEFDTLHCRRTGETLAALHHPGQPPAWGGIALLGAADPVPAGSWAATVHGIGGPQRVAAPIRLPGAVGLPAETEALVLELLALDPAGVPGYGPVLGGATDAQAAAAAAARVEWWTLWSDETAWPAPPPARFTVLGTLPSPVAVTRPTRAWVPLHVDWRVTYSPTPRGIADFPLGELDFEPPDPWPAADPAKVRTLTGRGILNDGPARLLEQARKREQESGSPLPVPSADAAACSFDGLLDRIRGVPEGLWFSPNGPDDSPAAEVLADEQYVPVAMAAGAWHVSALRVVDAFGRILTLDPAGAGSPVTPRIAEHLTAAGAPGPVWRPRFTAPVTVDFRFLDPDGATVAGGRPLEVARGQNPLVGWLAPTPVDGSAELFRPDGVSLGRLSIDRHTRRTTWEDTPTDGAVPAGAVDPSARIANPVLARLARSLIEADRTREPRRRSDSALGALLRTVATTLGSVDATGATGTGHLGLLLGTPLAIVRVGVTVDADDPQAGRAGTLAGLLTPVRIGSIVRLTDGVLAFWVEDQPDRLHPVHPLVAELAAPLDGDEDGAGPITHPYVATEPVVWVQPDRMRTLTLLVAPGAQLTATTGLGPQKVLDLLPEWTDRPAGLLTPTLAFDGVLRAVDSITLPTADDINGVWSWYHHPAGGTAWVADELTADPAATSLGDAPSRVEDGYLRVRLLPPPDVKGVTFQVTCIRRYGPRQTIQELGIRNGDGTITRLPIDEAIRLIESDRVRFFVDVDGRRAFLLVDFAASGRKYLRTEFDTTTVNNLAALPTC